MVTAVQDERAERTKLAAALKATIAKRDAEAPRLRRAREALIARRQQLLEEADSLGSQYAAAGATMDSIDRDIAKLERALRESADPRIDVLARNLNDWWDWKRNRGGGGSSEMEEANAALPRIKRARAELEALQLAASADVETELRRILAESQVTTQELKQAMYRQSW